MDDIPHGYTNSQTWESWYDGFLVLWDNTSVLYMVSVLLCICVVILSMFIPKPYKFWNKKNVAKKIQSVSDVKKETWKSLELSPDQQLQEDLMKEKQLEAIYNLMKEQEDQFGSDVSIEEVKEQMKLYCG